MNETPEQIMSRWITICSDGKKSKAIDEAYQILCTALDNNDIEKVRLFCKAACNVQNECESVCISVLTVGHWRYDELKIELKLLYDAIHAAISKKHDTQYATECLVGLEIN